MRTTVMSVAGAALALALCACGSPDGDGASAVAGSAPSVSSSVSPSESAPVDATKSAELLEAALAGDLVKVKALLADGAQPDVGVAQTLIYGYGDDPTLVTAMLAAGLDPNIADSVAPEHTALMWTGEIGHPKMAKALLDGGADIDKLDTYDDPAVSVAAFNGHLDVVKLLVARGAALDKRGLGDNTAVGHAKRAGYSKIAAYLVSKGAPE
jgi:ankyrin repeat protein